MGCKPLFMKFIRCKVEGASAQFVNALKPYQLTLRRHRDNLRTLSISIGARLLWVTRLYIISILQIKQGARISNKLDLLPPHIQNLSCFLNPENGVLLLVN